MKILRLYTLILLSGFFILQGCDKDEPELLLASNFNLAIDEIQSNGTSLGFIDASSILGAVSFSTSGIDPVGAITISDVSGEIKIADEQMFDYELNQRVDAIVSVTDGTNTKRINVNITINNIDDIEYHLTTSKANYSNAADNTWVLVTANEYNLLAIKLLGVNKVATSDAEYDNASTISSSIANLSVVNNNGHSIASDHYLFGFKYHAIDNSNENCQVMLSTNDVTGPYSNLGDDLPAHDIGDQFFVLKGNDTKSTSSSYVAFYESARLGNKWSTGASYYVGFGLVTSFSLTDNNIIWLYQGLSTDVKQWN